MTVLVRCSHVLVLCSLGSYIYLFGWFPDLLEAKHSD